MTLFEPVVAAPARMPLWTAFTWPDGPEDVNVSEHYL